MVFHHAVSVVLVMAQIVKQPVSTFIGRAQQLSITEWAETLAFLLSTQNTTQSQPSWNSVGRTFETLRLIEVCEPTKESKGLCTSARKCSSAFALS